MCLFVCVCIRYGKCVCVCVFRYGVVRMVGLVFEVCVCVYI